MIDLSWTNLQLPQSPSLADLQLLRLIESEGSYRGAARLLGIAHTTIQRRIKRLEQTLGIPLIQPSAGRIELTPWTARLIQQLNHQLDGVSETIKAA
ncbi:MAG: LysR family transcriptional regulator [Litoricolaceae bacterium]|nr:LysR family transcriptional regulator [Litorivicinaceae bacterium]